MPAWTTGAEQALLRRQAFVLTPEQIEYTNRSALLAITGSFFAVAAAIVILRCYVRISMLRVFGPDDYVIVVALFLATATFACFVEETRNGLGMHTLALLMNPVKYMNFTRLIYIHSIVIMFGVSTVKISVALFLTRLSNNKMHERFLYGVIAFICMYTIACAMTLIFQCLPVEAAWDSRLRPPPFGTGTAKCYSTTIFRNLGLMNSSFNILTDVLFATLPIPLIWQLQLNNRTKVSLIAILSLGWFACASAIIKAVQQYHIFTDLDWTVHDSFNIWNYIEFTVGIIAASLPTLKPLFNWFLETARAITSGGRSKGASGYRASAYGKGANSLGYHQHTSSSNPSIALQSIESKGDANPGSYNRRGPYNVKVTSDATGLADKEAWDIVGAKNSDESIRPLQQPEHNPNGIVMTREIRID